MSKFGIGQAARRVEDQRFTTGAGQFVADFALPRQCYGVAVLSPHAHAVIKRVDATRAKAAPGVLCVLTGADAATDKVGGIPPFFMPESWGGPKGFPTTRPVLLADRVRCVGDRVAFVVAETEAQARDAAELVEVDYRAIARAGRSRAGGEGASAENLGTLPQRQYRRDDRVRRQGGDRLRLRQGQARRQGSPGQQPRDRESDRAALRRRRLRRGRRQIHAPHHLAGSAQCPRGGVSRAERAGIEDQRDLARCRRRLRHEGQSLSRRHSGTVGGKTLRPAGQMDRDAQRKPVAATIMPAIRSSMANSRSTSTENSSPSGRPPIRRSVPIGGPPRPRRCSGR